ncbi:branched-chain amino acid ABC transporter substrate-binding protein [Veillonella tobetsuensis]|uniref:Branched-chain amino acid ABC transporter substrate-binding protein n=1 Tax=Veillonella tobetsuensis TaxID=1110546 RepID=A0A480B7Y9_9FIRM|nr:ABC transporter substrate-binding protein [Veillonella tobetsuensis]GCL69703.1 branched-chain amino acid ABC transporter substrate-binding protein [Veillonella tobetsuensis]
MNKSMLKKVAVFGLAGVMAVAAGCGSNKDAGNANSNEAKIALLTTTTGGAAAYGESIKAGAELAVSEINADANAVKINLLVEDTKGDKNEAINAMNKVIAKDKVVAVIGPMLSGEMMAAGPVANKSKVVALGTSTTAEGITDIGDYIFRNAVPESLAVDTAIKEAHKTLDFKTAAIMYSNNNDQMVSVNNTARKALESVGVQIVDTETFADKDTDFSAQLTKIQQAKPDVIIVASLYQEGALIMKKMREMGMNQPVVGSNGFNSPQFIKIAGDAANGVIVGTPWFPNKEDQKVKDFRKAYVAKYGKEPDQFAAQAYDAVYLYEAALKKAGSTTDREKFREALKNIADFVGVTGQFKFNEKRDPSMEVQVLQIKNGQFDALTK